MNPLYPKVRELLDTVDIKPPTGLAEYSLAELLAEIEYRLIR